VPLPARNYPDSARRVAFFQDLLGRVSRLPGVTAVGLNSGLHPFGNMRTRADVSGAPATDDPVEVHHVNAGYTAALGIRLASGRTFTDADVNAAAPVALVNDRFVRMRLEGRQPLGQFVRLPWLKQPPFGIKEDAFQIVGVVHDVLNRGVDEPAMPEIYVPFTAVGIANLLVVRTENDPSTLTRAIVSQIYAVDPSQPVTEVKPLDVILREEEFATPRFNLTLLSVFAGLGLALAIVGVYGVMSTVVAQQRHEIGVRMALGASAGTIARMIIGRGSRLLVVGIVLGLAGSILAARSLAQQVWNVSPFDPVAFGLVSVILLAAGLQACVWPARRAARIDPVIALRQD
jgi:putative ABC transport system permease protein